MSKRYDKPLTPEQLALLPDDEIDTSDIPELDDKFWENAKLMPPRTQTNVSLRVPQEVVAFFKSEHPKGYTARMAAVLSAHVKAHQQSDAH